MIKMKLGLFLIMLAFASDDNKVENDAKYEERFKAKNVEDLILVKIEEDEHTKVKKTSKYIGVRYYGSIGTWHTFRRSKNEKKMVYNGSYKDEETAAHASDTLARKLMANGEQNHKLNFPDDDTEVSREEVEQTSIYIGVYHNNRDKKWYVARWIKYEKKRICNGSYKDEQTAAHASDTLARKLMENGEMHHKLNFPDDNIEVYQEKETTSSIYIGVSYNESSWIASRYNKNERKMVYNGSYKDEETAALASDTLARNLMENGEQNYKLNFPDNHTEVYRPEEKSPSSIYIGVTYSKRDKKWRAHRRSKNEKKMIYNSYYKDEETAAHASDNLAIKLMAKGEQNHKLNFPDDHTEVYPEHQRNKRKRSDHEDLGHSDYK